MMIRASTSDVFPAGALAAFASCLFALGVVAGELPGSVSAPAGAPGASGSVSDLLNHAQSAAAADRFEQLLIATKGAPAASQVSAPEKPAVAPAPIAPAAPAAPQAAEAKTEAAPSQPPSAPPPTVATSAGLPTRMFQQPPSGKLQGHAPRTDAAASAQ